MIRFDSVSKHYPDGTIAVDSLDLVAPSGQITVFVGPSGCGKTTSLRMINRMIEPTSGTVWLDDRDTSTIATHELRRQIGYVIQHAGLFPHRTILDNIATVPLLLGWDRRKARARSRELLERVGLPAHFAERYPAQLSGGQQQRVGVARALAADPPVMLMDEPFSAVDPIARDQLQEEFLRLQGELGKTIVFVTHDIDEAIKLGDQVAVLRVGGRLAQLAAPAQLLSEPADAFVASFVGRDRGYRALGFTPAHKLVLHDEPTIRVGSSLAGAEAADGWLLAVDEQGAPQGWLRLAGPGSGGAGAAGTVTEDLLHRGGTVAGAEASLRAALDACLSSPSGRGVVVDSDGRLAGTVTAPEVLTLIEQQRMSSDQPSARPVAGGDR
ncbi:ABC transporter ATP-binding protein [Jatrophihabitans sp.]|uniref:ABC transporter ATP-binding protein n=1 Tax=Jatrophihabitans sp. TaxID=1932789 RepID=UPI002B9CA60E|nr:ABC transporter ATP-binding protein [Jatrophihabitans sp.]